jgi:hypothetical protein
MEPSIDIRKIFRESEIYTGKIKSLNNKNVEGNNVLFRCCVNENDSTLCFLLYDYRTLYFCRQNFDEINKLNKEINSSLEFSDINSLLNFLLENLIRAENNLSIIQNNTIFSFEILVDIIKVKWMFKCDRLGFMENDQVNKQIINYILNI